MKMGRHPYTDSLVALAACTPTTARRHLRELDTIVTPLCTTTWERGLSDHPDRQFMELLCVGIREGFRVGFNYREHQCRKASKNMRSVREHRDVVEEYIHKEREAGRLLGPFQPNAFPEVQVNPFGVIPKSELGKWHLIVDMSSPEGGSVNDGICKEWCSLSYISVDDVARAVVKLGKGALMAKFDLKAAYRNVPVHPDDRWLLGMVWENQLFVDVALPFRLRSAPIIFSALADGLEFMIRQAGVERVGHYLDDFVLVGPPGSRDCGRFLQVALRVCKDSGFPVAEEKTVGPTTLIPLLGIELDLERLELRLPPGKLTKLCELVGKWRRRKCCTKEELQSLTGHLNHACKVVRPGRRFLRGVFRLLSQFRRPDHQIRLNAAFRADLEWWHTFVSAWNGVSMMLKESLLFPGVVVWSDASGSWGCGAHWGNQWCQVPWGEWLGFASASIAAKELLPIIVATAIWGPWWKGLVVMCHCDNEAVVASIKGGYCRDPGMAHMLRYLFYLEVRFDILLTATHVAGVDNKAADAISRNKLDVFLISSPRPHGHQAGSHLVWWLAW